MKGVNSPFFCIYNCEKINKKIFIGARNKIKFGQIS